MRSLLVLTLFLFSFNVAAHEKKDFLLLGDFLHPKQSNGLPSLLEIESSVGKNDRLDVVAAQPDDASDQAPVIEAMEEEVEPPHPGPSLVAVQPSEASNQTPEIKSGQGDVEPPAQPLPPPPAPSSMNRDHKQTSPVSLDDLCNALLTAAQGNELPVPFFANLIWQESRLQNDSVSKVGALGIAQFMPEVAAENGLKNPFDPLQAISASARLLSELRGQFGNLGYAAAAYNAGPHRVSEWLEHGHALPHETQVYVIRITGRTAEDWRKAPPGDSELSFARALPCLSLPAFAQIEDGQMQEARLDMAEARLDALESEQDRNQNSVSMRAEHRHIAERKHHRTHGRDVALNTVARRDERRQAERDRNSHERRKVVHERRSRVA